MSAIFGAQTKWLDATLDSGVAPGPQDYILIAAWYNRTVDSQRFDDKLFAVKPTSATDQQLYITNIAGTVDPRLVTGGIRGSSARSAGQTSDLTEGTWRLAGGLLPPCPTSGGGSGTLVGWDDGTEVSIEMPVAAVSSGLVDYFSLGQGGNFNFYSFFRGRLAEAAIFIVGDQTEAETIMAALETATADSITLPAGSTLLAYYPLLSDATATVGPALTNHGSVAFDDTDHPDLGGGSPTAYTLTADAGSFGLTGKAAGLKRAKKLAAAAQAFSLTGKTVALRRGLAMPGAAGVFSLTGQTAAFARTRKLAAAKGAFTYTGKAANLNKGFRIAASPAAFTLTGKDAAFKRAYALAAVAGGFSLTGIAAGFKRALKLSAGVGGFTLSGQDAALTQAAVGHFVLSGATGSFDLTGKDAVLQAARTLALTSGTFALTGNDTGLLRGLKLLAEAGVFSVDGKDAVMKLTRSLRAESAVFALTGQDIRLIAGEQFNFPDTEVLFAPWAQRTIIVALEPRTVYAQRRNTPFVTDEDRTIIAPNRRSP